MQSGREATLEERYALKFCFKLGKNATETYGMLQTAFGASCMNGASVFEWHKRFKERRESVRDDERFGRSKEVRTPELIGQIKNFMDKDRCVSIETISAQFNVSVGTVHTIIRGELKMQKMRSLSQGCSEKIRKKNVVMTAGIWSSWSIQIPQFLMVWWAAVKVGSPAMTQRPRDRVPSGSILALPDPRRPDRANPRTNFWWSLFLFFFFFSFFDSTGMIYMHWTDSQQGILCWGFKGVQKEIPSKEARTLQIESVAFPPGQCTSPQLHPCHRQFDQDRHQDNSSASL